MIKEPSVTVVMAAFNAGKFIDTAIESVVRQTYPFWEMIIVDDGSTDSTRGCALRREKSDKRIRVVTIKHAGLGAARNVGIDNASGKWITFLDADDILSPYFIGNMMAATSIGEVDVVAAPMKMFKEKISFEKGKMVEHKIVPTLDIVRNALFKRGKINSSMCGKMFEKSLFKRNRFSENIFFEDLELFPRLILSASSDTVVLNTPLYGYRQHSSSFIHTLSSHSFDSLEAALLVEIYICENAPALKAAAADRVISAAFNVLVKLYKNKIDAPQLKKRCISSILERNISKESRLRNKIAVRLLKTFS